MKTAGNDIDYTDTLWKQFGKPGWTFGMISFIIMFTVPIILLFQLLSQNLFPIILAVIEMINGGDRELSLDVDWSEFSYSWTCVIIFATVYIMGIPKDVSIYAKINSFGVVFIAIIILFIFGLGFYGMANTDYTYSESAYNAYKAKRETDPSIPYLSYIDLASSSFAPIMGILGGGYYFHNMSLAVIRNSRNPENNIRDVFVGYLLVFLTYVCSGTLGYYGFTGSMFAEKLDSDNYEM